MSGARSKTSEQILLFICLHYLCAIKQNFCVTAKQLQFYEKDNICIVNDCSATLLW